MPKTKKRFLILGIMLAITLVGFCFLFVFDIDRKNVGESNAEVGENKVEIIQDAEDSVVHNSAVAYAEQKPSSTYLVGWLKYDNAHVSTSGFERFNRVSRSGSRWGITWYNRQFSLTPINGFSWAVSSYSGTVYRSVTSSLPSDPTTVSWSSYSSETWSRDGNTFKTSNTLSVTHQGKERVALMVDVSTTPMLNNYWSTTPSISNWTSGQTASTPTGQAAAHGTTTFTYYDSNQNELGGMPTTPGNYYMRCYDSGSGMVNPITSDLVSFTIYAPNPTMTTTSFQWTGSSIDASANNNCSYNSTYVNAPSGVTGTNVQSYTATFTTLSGYLFNNGTNTYTISWNITKRTVVLPSVSGSYTYDGSSKSATIGPPVYVQSYAAYVNQSGTASATNAGTYTVYFDLKNTSTMVWSDTTNTQKSGTWTIARATVATKPTASGGTSFTYTGSAINFAVSDYNTNYMTLSGYIQRTNVGSYSATFTPKANYAWTDGTTGAVTLNWSITQATNSWTSSPSITSWTYGSAPSTVNVGTPKFGSSFYIWGVVNADVFETYYVVDMLGYSGFSKSAPNSELDCYLASDWQDYPMIGMMRSDGTTGNVQYGVDFSGNDIETSWAQLPAGRYYFYSWVGATSINYTTSNIYKLIEFYIWVPEPTVTNTSKTYNGSTQGPTITNNSYSSIWGTTTAKNAGNYNFYYEPTWGFDNEASMDYFNYYEGFTIDDILDEVGWEDMADWYTGVGNNWDLIYDDWNYVTSSEFIVNWSIAKASISGGTITIPQTDFTYDGTEKKPTPTVTVP